MAGPTLGRRLAEIRQAVSDTSRLHRGPCHHARSARPKQQDVATTGWV